MIKKYIFLVVIFVLSSGFGTNEVSTDDMVEEIHRLVNTEENMTRALEQIFLPKLNLQDDTKVKKVKEEISNLVSDVMVDDAYFNDFKELYLNVFTEKEIAQLLDFYKSEVGQKMLEKTGYLALETQRIADTHLRYHFRGFRQSLDEILEVDKGAK